MLTIAIDRTPAAIIGAVGKGSGSTLSVDVVCSVVGGVVGTSVDVVGSSLIWGAPAPFVGLTRGRESTKGNPRLVLSRLYGVSQIPVCPISLASGYKVS